MNVLFLHVIVYDVFHSRVRPGPTPPVAALVWLLNYLRIQVDHCLPLVPNNPPACATACDVAELDISQARCL